MNPLVQINDEGDGYSGIQSYAMEADVNTDVPGVGTGIGIFGTGTADPFAGVVIARDSNKGGREGVRVRDVRNWAFRYVDKKDNHVCGVQPSGNMDMGGSDIFNFGIFKSASDTDANYQILLQSSSVYQRHNFSIAGTSLFAIEAEGVGSGGASKPLVNFKGTPLKDVRSSPTALAADDLNIGEIAVDEANGRLVWKDDSGSAYYVGGNAL